MAEIDNAEAQQPQPGDVMPRRVRSEKYISMYVNQVELGYTSWDIQLSLLQVHGRNEDLIAEELASVIMSPQHAKAIIIPMINTIIQYEDRHGVVRLPGQKKPMSLSDVLRKAAAQIKDAPEDSGEDKDSGEDAAG